MLLHIWLEEVHWGVASGHAWGVAWVDQETLPGGDHGNAHFTLHRTGQHFFVSGTCKASGGRLVTVLEKRYLLQV